MSLKTVTDEAGSASYLRSDKRPLASRHPSGGGFFTLDLEPAFGRTSSNALCISLSKRCDARRPATWFLKLAPA